MYNLYTAVKDLNYMISQSILQMSTDPKSLHKLFHICLSLHHTRPHSFNQSLSLSCTHIDTCQTHTHRRHQNTQDIHSYTHANTRMHRHTRTLQLKQTHTTPPPHTHTPMHTHTHTLPYTDRKSTRLNSSH